MLVASDLAQMLSKLSTSFATVEVDPPPRFLPVTLI